MRGILTLCGSHRFKDTFDEISQHLAFAGWLVLRPEFYKDAHTTSEEEKKKLDEIHKEKISLSQAIVMINVDGYVGESTLSELEYARGLGKMVYWYDLLGNSVLIELPDKEWRSLI